MPAHYVALTRGVDGFQFTDYTSGTSPAGGAVIELRVEDNAFRRRDIQVALDAFERLFQNPQFFDGNASGQSMTAPPGFAFALLD